MQPRELQEQVHANPRILRHELERTGLTAHEAQQSSLQSS